MTQLWTTSDYAPRDSQDCNQIYSNSQVTLSNYSNGNGVHYLNSSGGSHYSAMAQPYSPYPTPFVPSQPSPGALMYMQTSGAGTMPYQMQPLPSSTLPSQSRTMSHQPCYSSSLIPHRTAHQHARLALAPDVSLTDTEEQDSPDNENMHSEPISPPLDGYPVVTDFDDLMRGYVENLSPKKRDKALIHAKRAANIKAVLVDKKTTAIESAQFRFWVKKMFTLEPKDPSVPAKRKKICHEGKPVAIREKLFKILTKAHKQCQHGGRDKTSAQVRRVYSWVPKELISRFVKLCPTCQIRRGTNRTSPSESDASTAPFLEPQSPILSSNNPSRRQCLVTGMASNIHPSPQMPRYVSSPPFGHESSILRQQNRWMTSSQPLEKSMDGVSSLEVAGSAMVNMNMNTSSPVSPENLTPAASKFAEDPGTPYLGSHGLQTGMIGSAFQHGAFGGMHTMHELHFNEDPYRLGRGPTLKRESRF